MAFFDFLTGGSDKKRDAKNVAENYKMDLIDRSHELYNDIRGRMGDIAVNPGYSPQEQQGINLAATAPIAGAYGSAQGQLANRAAMTGNATGLIPATEAFARAKARDISQAAVGAQQQIGDKRIQGTQFAAQGLIPLYSPALGAATGLVSEQFQDANKPGFFKSILQQGLGAAGQVLGGGLTKAIPGF